MNERMAVMEEIARHVPGLGSRQLARTADAVLARLARLRAELTR